MRVITIFSGKGGVGKTTMSIIFSSWLKYHMHERVVAYDFESPESRMMNKRRSDLTVLSLGAQSLKRFCESEDYYPIGAIKTKPDGFTDADLQTIAKRMREAKASGDGYIVCDFPGHFERRDAIFTLAKEKLIDLVVFPVQPEEQSVASMYVVNKILRGLGYDAQGKNRVMCFWNMVTRNDNRNKQDIIPEYEKDFNLLGIPVAKTKVKFADTFKRSSSAPVFITTTVCYPRANVVKACPPEAGQNVPYIENLFQEIKDCADATII